MTNERILEYKNQNLTEKNLFENREEGCVGTFELNNKKQLPDKLIIFAPNQEDFDYNLSREAVPNHRFLEHLKEHFECISNIYWNYFTGGKIGNYKIDNERLFLYPLYKDKKIIKPSYQETCEIIGKLLVEKNIIREFTMKKPLERILLF